VASGTLYQVKSVDYEPLSVAKNGTRWVKILSNYGFMPKPVEA
jgi:hypothetical protein